MEILILSVLLIFTLFWAFSSMGLVRFPRRKKRLPPTNAIRRPQQRRGIFHRLKKTLLPTTPIIRRPQQRRSSSIDPSKQHEFKDDFRFFDDDISTETGETIYPADASLLKGFEEKWKKHLRGKLSTKTQKGFFWKIHIEHTPALLSNAKELYEFEKKTYEENPDPLFEFLFNKGYNFKPDVFTIYVGSKDEAIALADELVQNFGDVLGKKINFDLSILDKYHKVLEEMWDAYEGIDTIFDNQGKISARFSGTGSEYKNARKGLDGLPFLTRPAEVLKEYDELIIHKGNSQNALWRFKPEAIEKYGSEYGALKELTKVMDKTYAYLERELGTFFTGTGSNKQIGYYPGKYFR